LDTLRRGMLATMTCDPTDREDLLRDATALVARIELAPPGGVDADHVVVGFRAEGAASFFFGSDPVYQFNTVDRLRSAYCDDRLIKAVRGRLVSLERVRQQGEVQLLRRELSEEKQTAILARMRNELRELAAGLDEGRYRVVGQVPAESDVLARVQAWLADHDEIHVAATPHVQAPTSEHCG
jgi:hypothetical protein